MFVINSQKNHDDSSSHLESFKLQVSVLNNQVDTLLRKLNHLETYLSQQSELRQIAENKLREVVVLHCDCVLFIGCILLF